MDESKVREIVEANIDAYLRAFGIPHWRITVEYWPAGEGVGSFVSPAAYEMATEYERAAITLDPHQLRDEEQVLECLRHELFHILAWPFCLYRRTAWVPQIADGSDDDRREDKLFDIACEQFVRNMERLWFGMCAFRVNEQDAEGPNPLAKSKYRSPSDKSLQPMIEELFDQDELFDGGYSSFDSAFLKGYREAEKRMGV